MRTPDFDSYISILRRLNLHTDHLYRISTNCVFTSNPEQPSELHMKNLVDEFVSKEVSERSGRSRRHTASDQGLGEAQSSLWVLVFFHVEDDEGTLLDSKEKMHGKTMEAFRFHKMCLFIAHRL